MSVSATSAYTGYTATDTTTQRDPVKTLGQDDFLQLLVTQMTTQDPMNPKTDTEFIGQMAQFSALEQNKLIEQRLASLSAEQQVSQAHNVLGRQVELQADDGTVVTGVVSAVKIEAGTPKILVNGQAYDLSQVSSVAMAPVN